MTAQEILSTLEELGVEVELADEGKLRLNPGSKVDKALQDLIIENKPGILAALSSAVTPVTAVTPIGKADTYVEFASDGISDGISDGEKNAVTLPPRVQWEREMASELGLVARWSKEFGYISIHDPLEGEWHDIATKDAPGWAKREAFKRRELYKTGRQDAYTLSQAQMEEIWEEEQAPLWDKPFSRPDDAKEGLVYDAEEEED